VWGRYEPLLGLWGKAPAAKRFLDIIGAYVSAGWGKVYVQKVGVRVRSTIRYAYAYLAMATEQSIQHSIALKVPLC